jgi:hypothetical protein
MARVKRVKARVFTIHCERNDAYEHELETRFVAHKYHGFDFFVPVELDTQTVTTHIMGCLKKCGLPLISIDCSKFFKPLSNNAWGLAEIEHSIELGYHR